MTAYVRGEAAEQARAARVAEWIHPEHPGCCWACGWHVSAHAVSSYGLDCPWGMSPAAAGGVLPRQTEPGWRPARVQLEGAAT